MRQRQEVQEVLSAVTANLFPSARDQMIAPDADHPVISP
jgi:hypothetical protein